MKDLTTNQIIIAEFLGRKGKYNSNLYTWKGIDSLINDLWISVDKMKFHSDWNWLMTVVKKCLKICHENMLEEWKNSFADKFLSGDIEMMFKEVISFIKWSKIAVDFDKIKIKP